MSRPVRAVPGAIRAAHRPAPPPPRASLSGVLLGGLATAASAAGACAAQRRAARKRGAFALQRAGAVVAHPRLLGLLNLLTFWYLLVHAVSLMHHGGLRGAAAALGNCVGGLCDEAPYPLDIALQARSHVLQAAAPAAGMLHFAGYVGVKPGTFRSRYPSVTVEDVFDDVHVITNDKCPSQWTEFQRHARRAGLPATQWPMPAFKHISLADPPIPIAAAVLSDRSAGSRVVVSILKRQVAYLLAHRAVWRHVVETGRQRVLVVDDTVIPNDRLLRLLPSMFNQVDQESLALQTPWHIVTLRRKASSSTAGGPVSVNDSAPAPQPEAVWCANPRYNHAVVRARASYGAGMYALSVGGARWLLEHVREYRAPMDVEFALLQRDHPDEFVVLSACNNDEPRDFCPEIAADISVGTARHQFECVWRRLQERRIAALAESALPVK
jgi:hypothetical protein